MLSEEYARSWKLLELSTTLLELQPERVKAERDWDAKGESYEGCRVFGLRAEERRANDGDSRVEKGRLVGKRRH